MKALTLTSLVMALVLASPGEAKDSTDISPGTPLVAPVPRPDRARLKRNDSGGDVPILQRALNNHGERLTVDGIFGRQTEKAVKDFQAQSGLESTGVVDSGTWSALAAKPAPASDPALDLAKRDAEAAKAQAMELAKQVDSLNSELGTANAQRNELRIKLDLATSEVRLSPIPAKGQAGLSGRNAKRTRDRQARRRASKREGYGVREVGCQS